MAAINFDDFLKVDIRVGTITNVQDFSEARKSAYKLFINFGNEIGEKKPRHKSRKTIQKTT